MKTPMQEVINDLKQLQDVISFSGNHYIQKLTADLIQRAESMLDKEKEVIMDAYWEGGQDIPIHPHRAEEYFDKTFKTKER
jgi:hypothetical protein